MSKEWKDMNNQERRKAITGLFFLIIFIIFLWNITNKLAPTEKTNSIHSEKFSPELANIGDSLTMYKIINRNDYAWHNVKITVNDYYSCWFKDTLNSSDSITFNAITCNKFIINHNTVESILIESDEGTQGYSSK